MLKAHELQAQGFTQKQIAEQLGRTDRTIRTWLNQMPRERKKPVRKSKLDKYKPLIETLVSVNAGEKFPDFAGFRFPLLDKKIY